VRGTVETGTAPADSGGGIHEWAGCDRHQTPPWQSEWSRGGHYQANHTTRQADVLLALGVRFDDRTSSSWIPGYSFTIPPTRLIHVDIDPEEIGRNYPVALGLMADVRTFLRQVHAELDRRKDVQNKLDARKKWLGMIDGYRKRTEQAGSAGLFRRRPAEPKSTRACLRTRSWSATSACITTGCSVTARRGVRIP
jgi:thiamine pyrophosphate-dependent acetolactate synthase large subunit-like protein